MRALYEGRAPSTLGALRTVNYLSGSAPSEKCGAREFRALYTGVCLSLARKLMLPVRIT